MATFFRFGAAVSVPSSCPLHALTLALPLLSDLPAVTKFPKHGDGGQPGPLRGVRPQRRRPSQDERGFRVAEEGT